MNSPVALDELARAAAVIPLSSSAQVFFSAVNVRATGGKWATRLQGTSVAVGRDLSLLKSKMELLERVAQFEWSSLGYPAVDAFPMRCQSRSQFSFSVTGGARQDATGFCAGSMQGEALEHGLLEVLERDSVVRIFDRHENVRQVPVDSLLLRRLLSDQNATVDCFMHQRKNLPPTAIAVVASRTAVAGAIGTACSVNATRAVSRAVMEGVMMLTTARHVARRQGDPGSYRDIDWASRHIRELRQELISLSTGSFQDQEPSSSLVRSVEEVFEATPLVAEMQVSSVDGCGARVWRVLLAGALTSENASRVPWPVG